MKMTKEEYELAQFIMTDEEIDTWNSIYEENGEYYELQET